MITHIYSLAKIDMAYELFEKMCRVYRNILEKVTMDWLYDKHTWEMNQILKFEDCIKNVDCRTSNDPVIIVKNPDTGEYICGGISDYRDRSTAKFWRNGISQWDMLKTGTLELPFPHGKRIRMENVYSVTISWGKNHIGCGNKQSITLHEGLCYMIPDLSEIEEFYFAIQTVYCDPSTSKKKSDVLFFKGSTLLTKVKNVSAIATGNQYNGDIYYAKRKNRVYTHYIRDINNNIYIIGKSDKDKLACNVYRHEAITKIVNDVVDKAKEEGIYRFYFSSNSSTQGTVLESYLTRFYKPVKIDNYFSDDETYNYYIDVDINDINLIAFLKYYGTSGFAIYGIELDNYLPYLPYESEDSWYYNSVPQMLFHKNVLNNALESNCNETEDALMLSLEKLRKHSSTVQEQVVFKLFIRLLPDVMEYHNPYHDWAKKEYQAEKDYLLAENKLNCVWKGEFQMYKIAKELYDDAQYQYHCDWLGRQSLDVYIPSISVGIEYQGIQHYEPVDHFGGENAYLHRVELDNQKRQLCAANNVKLIEWRYDSPLTKNGLSKKIKNIIKETI